MILQVQQQLHFSKSLVCIVAIAAVVLQFAATAAASPSWIDPDTPSSALTKTGMDGRSLDLIFSDEFEWSDRSFVDGHDTRWTAEDRPGTTNAALQYYNSSKVTTKNGTLVIETTNEDAAWIEYDSNGNQYAFQRHYTSGMLTTWNKFCFTSGLIEISFKLPGNPRRGGLWPAFWMLGNLARPNYLDSTDGIWPWSYDQCGTSDEAVAAQQVQTMNGCGSSGGRGSPEIDIIEAQPGNYVLQYQNVEFVNGSSLDLSVGRPMISCSLQLAPGIDPSIRPQGDNLPAEGEWYSELYPMGGEAYGNDTHPHMINNYWYGQKINLDPEVWQDGMSVNWQHSESFYYDQTKMYVEWQTGATDGYVRWYQGNELIYEITADTLNSKPGASDAIPQIPFEAMYLILNTDVSPRWGWNGCNPNDECLVNYPDMCSSKGELLCRDCKNPNCLRCSSQTGWLADFCDELSTSPGFEIDYIRVYQDSSDSSHTVGCDPQDYPTKDYIQANWQKYTFNPYIKSAPLEAIQNGGGECSNDADCGTDSSESRGTCSSSGKCVCSSDWTGPNCLSPCIGDLTSCSDSSSTPSPVESPAPSPAFPDTSEMPNGASPTNAPTNVSPVFSTLVPTLPPSASKAETIFPTSPPSINKDSSCSAHPVCKELGLTGECCPATNGENLYCCSPLPPQCSYNPTCDEENKSGACCPMQNNTFRNCCDLPSAKCSANPSCAHLDGDCCPTESGTMLDCCTDDTSLGNATFEEVPQNAACSKFDNCQGLSGACCPTVDGVFLFCCEKILDTCQAHPKCATRGLTGECCPTSTGEYLDCCEREFAACSVNPNCAGKSGNCCPNDDGQFDACCIQDAAAQSIFFEKIGGSTSSAGTRFMNLWVLLLLLPVVLGTIFSFAVFASDVVLN